MMFVIQVDRSIARESVFAIIFVPVVCRLGVRLVAQMFSEHYFISQLGSHTNLLIVIYYKMYLACQIRLCSTFFTGSFPAHWNGCRRSDSQAPAAALQTGGHLFRHLAHSQPIKQCQKNSTTNKSPPQPRCIYFLNTHTQTRPHKHTHTQKTTDTHNAHTTTSGKETVLYHE